MRKLIIINLVSLDGRYEGPGNDFMAMPLHSAFDDYNAARLRAAGTLLLGRTTYDQFRGFWPSVADDPDAPAVAREISRLNNAVEKVVVSDTLGPGETAPWHDTRIVRRADAHAAIADLKSGPGGDVLMFGSHRLWNDLLAAGLVDELHLLIGPAVLGGGTPVYEGSRVPLRLLEARTLPGSPLLLTRHAPADGH